MRKELRIMVILIACMLALTVLDLPVRFSKFIADMPPYLGIKNAVAPASCLMVGPWGLVGSLIGIVFCGICDVTATWKEIFFEMTAAVIESLGIWLLWHAVTPSHKVRFKKVEDLLKYALITLGVSALSGGVSFLFIDGGNFFAVLIVHFVSILLVGVPAVIIYSGIMCQPAVIPIWCTRLHDIEADVENTDESFLVLNDKLEELAVRLGLSKKRSFEILNTVEEVYLRIRTHEPEVTVHVTIDVEEALSITFTYKGEKSNPLRISADEDLVALIGLKLIEHRAIRTSYRYYSQINEVLIVL
jgi:hypothetical protein